MHPTVGAVTLADLRKDYSLAGLSENDLARDPFRQFERWFQEAQAAKIAEPNAMTLCTSTREGRPSGRTVLLKGVDGRGFVFFTNYNSRKARELDQTGRAALLFYWPSLVRQVRIDGLVTKVEEAESDAYFATRPIESRWGVYASNQSEVIESRAALESRYSVAREMYGESIPRPSWWGGYRVVPSEFEFWQGRPNRLHDRLRYQREPDGWRRERLAP